MGQREEDESSELRPSWKGCAGVVCSRMYVTVYCTSKIAIHKHRNTDKYRLHLVETERTPLSSH